MRVYHFSKIRIRRLECPSGVASRDPSNRHFDPRDGARLINRYLENGHVRRARPGHLGQRASQHADMRDRSTMLRSRSLPARQERRAS